LHIGLEKTGSTAVLESLRTSAEDLERRGLSIPRGRHAQRALTHVFREEPLVELTNLDLGSKAAADSYKAELRAELSDQLKASRGHDVLISDEMLASLSVREIGAMSDFLRDFTPNICIVVYVRAPLDAAVSLSQQLIKTGHTTYGAMVRKPAYRPVRPRLERFITHFGPENVIARPFSRGHLHGESSVTDLMATIGRPDLAQHVSGTLANESISLPAALLKSAMARLSDGPIRHHNFLGAIVGPKFALPSSALSVARSIVEEDQRWIESHLGLTLQDTANPISDDDIGVFNVETLASLSAARCRVPEHLRDVYDKAAARVQSGGRWQDYA
jgi:hypothetical protein